MAALGDRPVHDREIKGDQRQNIVQHQAQARGIHHGFTIAVLNILSRHRFSTRLPETTKRLAPKATVVKTEQPVFFSAFSIWREILCGSSFLPHL